MQLQRKKYILPILSIIILGFAVYAGSLSGEFIWDDIAFVKDNVFIRDWSNAAKVFTREAGESLNPRGGKVRYNFYRPVQMLTYMVDYSLWKSNPFGYRLTNLLLHILAALAIFWLITILFDDWLLSLFTAVFLIFHPVHNEAVAFL